MKVAIYTLGCKVNAYESEYMLDQFRQHNYEVVDFKDEADVYIINTCTVTNTSDIKSRKIIRQAINKKETAIVVAVGCFIEANFDYEEAGLDLVIGNKNKSKIVEIVEDYLNNKKKQPKESLLDTSFEDMFITTFEGRTRAFVKIQDGCENFCTYCIIPYVRGKCRSKKQETVIEEITSLVNNNYQEIILTGIHTGNYGVDLNTNFASLLEDVVKIKNLKRLRISSIEITEITKKILDLIEKHDIIVDHLHIPLQSGCNKTLKDMNRKYDMDYFKNITEKLRTIRPNISITTDVIMGFPTETEEDFKETFNNIKEIKFSKLHVFPFSLRSGTKAEEFENIVTDEMKKQRTQTLLDLSKTLEDNYNRLFLNKEVEILIEKNKEGYSYGHTGNYLSCKIKGEYPSNTFIKGKIIDINYPYCVVSVEKS